MSDAADLEVWLEWQKSRPALIVPHARAAVPGEFTYQIELQRNISRMVQRGTVRLEAGVATPLSSMSVTRSPDDGCAVDVVLESPGRETFAGRFNCPP